MKHLNHLICIMILFSLSIVSCEKAEKPIAIFTMDKTSSEINETISFTNFSENATSYSWDFGDGNTSTVEHPTHSYSSAGTYEVTLTAKGEGGTDSNTNSIEIIVTLSGIWSTSFDLNGNIYDGEYDITQNDDNSLSGTFVFSDGSGYTNILSSSQIDGNNVTIKWMLSTYELRFSGIVNESFDYMSGSYYVGGSKYGDWIASKTSSKSAIIQAKNNVDSYMNQFIYSLEKE